jgi:hypothetical protein
MKIIKKLTITDFGGAFDNLELNLVDLAYDYKRNLLFVLDY